MRIHSTIASGFVAGVLVTVIATGVVAQSASPAESPQTGSLADTEWLLGTVGGSPVPTGVTADMLFSETQAGGFAGCNQFVTSYTSDGTSSLIFGPTATTLKVCDDATNTFEQSYLAALATVAAYRLGSDGGLTLSDSGGTAVLTYAPHAPSTIEGAWLATLVNNGTGAVTAVPIEMRATVSFHPDGVVEGFGGCNPFSGGYGVNGSTVTIGPLMSTVKACEGQADIFEQQYLTALQNATTWSVTSGTLDLRDASGAQQVEARSVIGH
jgi:heat shock protein HslJ